MEAYVAFDFLHGLVNVSIQHRNRAESLQVRKCLPAVLRSPSPLRINRPQRDVRKHDNRSARLEVLYIVLKPLQLLAPERAQTAGLEVHDVDQTDEVDAIFVKAVPALTFGVLGITFAEHLSVIIQHIVLAGHEED